MPERSGHSVYFSDDLRERVGQWAENSTSSRADLLDKALEDFFERHEISDDGTIVRTVDDGGEVPDDAVAELLDNQEEILARLEEGGGLRSTTGQEKNSESGEELTGQPPAPAEDSYEHLRQRYDHEEVIDPDDVSPANVPTTRTVNVPVAIGFINWMDEQDERREYVRRDKFLSLIRRNLDVSDETAKCYVEQMVERGVLVPHPSLQIDEEIIVEARERAMAANSSFDPASDSLDSVSETMQERYTFTPGEILGEIVGDNWKQEKYYFGGKEMAKDVWPVINTVIEKVGCRSQSTNRGLLSGDEMTEYDRAAAAVRLNGALIGNMAEYVDVPSSVSNANAFAARSGDSDEKRVKWGEEFVKARQWADEELYDVDGLDGDDLGESGAVEVFEEVLGVEVEEADDDELRAAYDGWMLENHPDQSGESLDTALYHRVMDAKDVLLG